MALLQYRVQLYCGGKVTPTNEDSTLNVYKVVELKGSKPVYPFKAVLVWV
jgi:hypothetical protein